MNNNDIKILMVDDEADSLEFMSYNIRKEGYQVFLASNGIKALEQAEKHLPHLIILDIMMPELDGIQTCKELRSKEVFKDTLIVFLTARSEEFTQVLALDIGADDYLTKPIKPRLMLSKIKSLLRRYSKEEEEKSDVIAVRDLEIDRDTFTLRKAGRLIELPRKEFNLLYLLASRPGKVFTREKILDKIWGNVIVNDRTIDVHIRKLREKLDKGYIKTVKGIGYKFKKGKEGTSEVD
ncbi:MAG: response regulator transcription factor [Chitinophagales bacterium]